MRTDFIHPLAFAIIFSVLLMGVLGAFIIVPIVCINWTWNSLIAHFIALPQIGLPQAGLLYLAGACILYLFGLIDIEFKTETAD